MSARSKAAKVLASPIPERRMPTIPKYVVEQYGSARGFRATKRSQLKAVRVAMDKAFMGCAFFPGGSAVAQRIRDSIAALTTDLSVKSWGR